MKNWGGQSERPDTYWQPWLGSLFGLRPCDLADLTPFQMDACREHMEQQQKAGAA